MVFWKQLVLSKRIVLLLRTPIESPFCWGLHWTSLRGCWIRLRFMHDLFCTWYVRRKMNTWIYWFMHFVYVKLWFLDTLSWIVLTPWKWFSKIWFLLCRLVASAGIIISVRIEISDLIRSRWSFKMLHTLWTYRAPVCWVLGKTSLEEEFDSCFPKYERKMACPRLTEFLCGGLQFILEVACRSMSLGEI